MRRRYVNTDEIDGLKRECGGNRMVSRVRVVGNAKKYCL